MPPVLWPSLKKNLRCIFYLIYLFFQLYWGINDTEHHLSLRCTRWWFDTCMYCKMITTIRLVNTFITSRNYLFLWWETFKIYSLRNFQVYNTVFLIIVTILYIRCPELNSSSSLKSVPLDQHLPFSSSRNPWKPPFYSLFPWVWLFSDSTCQWDHTVFVFLCLTYFT